MKIQQTIATKNDANGNPRRIQLVWLALDTQNDPYGTLIAVIDHGYRGAPKYLSDGTPINAVDLGRVNVAPSEYNEIKRDAKANGLYSYASGGGKAQHHTGSAHKE